MLLFTKDKGTTFLVNSQIKIKALLLSQSNAFFVVNKIFRIIAELLNKQNSRGNALLIIFYCFISIDDTTY